MILPGVTATKSITAGGGLVIRDWESTMEDTDASGTTATMPSNVDDDLLIAVLAVDGTTDPA
ncbi:unnamed protein product, partial [marine sediment metagenome]